MDKDPQQPPKGNDETREELLHVKSHEELNETFVHVDDSGEPTAKEEDEEQNKKEDKEH